VLALVTAWSLVINGVVRIVDSVATRARELWWFGLAGVVELGLGLWAISSPGRELLLLVNLIGIYVIIAGVDAIVVAVTAERSGEAILRHAFDGRVRPQPSAWRLVGNWAGSILLGAVIACPS